MVGGAGEAGKAGGATQGDRTKGAIGRSAVGVVGRAVPTETEDAVRVEDPRERRIQDVAFGLLLASGLSVGYVFLLAFRNWVTPQGEDAFGIYVFGSCP